MPRPLASFAVAAVAAIALSACSGAAPEPSTPVAVGGPDVKQLPAPKQTILSANSTAQLGTVVIDGFGFTLYRFDDDSADPSTATCVDECAREWPPVLEQAGEDLVLEQVREDEVGTVERPDGSTQVTIGGWPVYRYAADSGPGSTDGHGKGRNWFAITPDGKKAEAP